MRLFVAVHPGDQLRRELATRIDPVARDLARCRALRWTRPEAWHLTLQFLGDWPEARTDGLKQALARVPVEGPLHLQPAGLGAFPDLRRPRVLFLHLDSGGKAEQLADRVRQAVQEVWPRGPQDLKAFRAHLTLARVKGTLSPAEIQAVQRLDLEGLPGCEVGQFRLVASELHRYGARHRALASVPLTSSGDDP